MAKMQEVAKQANVSVATVSRVINGNGYVSHELRERVEEAIKILDYQPSILARNLRQQTTQTVGFLIPQLNQPFFSTLAYAVEQTLFPHGYHTLMCSAEEDRDKEDAYVEMLISRQVDGVLLVPTGHSVRHIERLIELNIPVVLVDRDLPELTINRVLCDNYQGAYNAMSHLIELGHQQVGIVGAPSYSESMANRIRGAQQALIDNDLPLNPDLLVTDTQQQFDVGFTAMQVLLNAKPQPTAIFALTDIVAIGVLHAVSAMGLAVPDDLSVMGFDNIDHAAYSIPELTTVAQPIEEMGTCAAEILLQHMGKDEETSPVQSITLSTNLIIRKSTAQLTVEK